MDLIPIIEYTLLIFIGLLLVVILSSYLIFLLRRNRSNGSDESELNVSLREYPQYEPEVKYLIPLSNEEEIADDSYIQNSNSYTQKNRLKSSGRFTVLNPGSSDVPSYSPERVNSFDHRFAPTKSKDAFAMFR